MTDIPNSLRVNIFVIDGAGVTDGVTVAEGVEDGVGLGVLIEVRAVDAL